MLVAFEPSKVVALTSSGRKPKIEEIIRATFKALKIMTSKGEVSPERVLEELIDPETKRVEIRKTAIEIVVSDALDLIQTWLAITISPWKKL